MPRSSPPNVEQNRFLVMAGFWVSDPSTTHGPHSLFDCDDAEVPFLIDKHQEKASYSPFPEWLSRPQNGIVCFVVEGHKGSKRIICQ